MSLLNAVVAKPEAFGPYGGKVEMNDGKHEVSARANFVEGAIGTNRMAVDLRRASMAAAPGNEWITTSVTFRGGAVAGILFSIFCRRSCDLWTWAVWGRRSTRNLQHAYTCTTSF